jgi:hypothetical protein
MVLKHARDHTWRRAAATPIAAEIGCRGQKPRDSAKEAEILRATGWLPVDMAERLEALERKLRASAGMGSHAKFNAHTFVGRPRPPVQ